MKIALFLCLLAFMACEKDIIDIGKCIYKAPLVKELINDVIVAIATKDYSKLLPKIKESLPELIQTTIPEPLNYNICTYYVYWHYNCSFVNLSNSEILSRLMTVMLRTYPSDGLNTEINALDGYAFQFTNSLWKFIFWLCFIFDTFFISYATNYNFD